MTTWTLARRGLRALFGWWWRAARPAAGGQLHGRGEAQPAHVAGRAPRPEERWRPTGEPTGPWADFDPYAAGRWPRRGSLLVVAAWAGVVGLRVRRDLRALERSEPAGTEPHGVGRT